VPGMRQRRRRSTLWAWLVCLAICGAAIKSVQIVQFRAKLAEVQSFDQTAEHDQARRLIEELLAEDADHPEVLRLYARNAAAMREWRQAADALVKLPEKQPDDLFLEATLFTNLQRYDDAARSWSRLSIVSDQADAMLKSYLQQLHESGNVAQVVDLVRKLTQTPDGRLPTAEPRTPPGISRKPFVCRRTSRIGNASTWRKRCCGCPSAATSKRS
jgi:uncharacterized protein HemY